MLEKVKQYLTSQGLADRILEFTEPGASATVEMAAKAVGCEPAHIAKSLAFIEPENGRSEERRVGTECRG